MRGYSPWGNPGVPTLATLIPRRTLCVCRARTCLCSSSMSKGSQQEVGSEGREDSPAPRVLQPLPMPCPPSQLGRTTHCKSCGSELPPQRLSNTAAPQGLLAAGGRGKAGTDCQKSPDPKGPRRTLLTPGLHSLIPSLNLHLPPMASNFMQPLPCLVFHHYVWGPVSDDGGDEYRSSQQWLWSSAR